MKKLHNNSSKVYKAIKLGPSSDRSVNLTTYRKGWYDITNVERPIMIDDYGEQYMFAKGKCEKIVNRLLDKKYQYNIWITKERVLECGYKIKRGQRPVSQIVRLDQDITPENYQLYNIEQTTHKLPKLRNYNHDNRIEVIDNWINGLSVNIAFNGFPPQYFGDRDLITFPHWNQFRSSYNYYATLFHEIGHSTGHQNRLKRPSLLEQIDNKDPQYGVEEAIAELIALKLCEYWNVPVDINQHIMYISSWLDFLVNEQKVYMFRYCDMMADNAVAYLLKEKYD